MGKTTADSFADALSTWGVEVIFGRRGSGLSGFLDALQARQDRIRFIEVQHEEAASLMACGYARFTGKIGVCLGAAGHGGIRLLPGLYDARLDGQPVLVITGAQPNESQGVSAQQEVAFDRLFMDVAAYNTRIGSPDQVENAVNQAFRSALGQRTVAHIVFPSDIQNEPARRGNTSILAAQTSTGLFAQRARLPYGGDLRQAADLLNSGEKVAILVGRGALGAASELEIMSTVLAAPVIKTLQGKAVLPAENPNVTGSLGPLGTEASLMAIRSCDTLLLVGTSFPYIDYLLAPGAVRAIQIDSDPTRIGLRYPVEVGLVGDSQRTLKELLPFLEHKQERSFLESVQEKVTAWRSNLEEEGSRQEGSMMPQQVAWELGQFLPSDAVMACDSGPVTAWWARYIWVKDGQLHAFSGSLAVPGSSLPYALAAQIAYPNRPCVAFTGNAEFISSMTEFATCVRYDTPVKVMLLNHLSASGPVEEQVDLRTGGHLPEAPIDFAAFARACGGAGFTVREIAEICPALEAAFASPLPTIIDFQFTA